MGVSLQDPSMRFVGTQTRRPEGQRAPSLRPGELPVSNDYAGAPLSAGLGRGVAADDSALR
jgi:hypothetical protein